MSLKKGLTIFLLLSLAVSGAVLYCTVDGASLHVFADADWRYMALAMFFVVCVWIVDALKLCELTKAAGERMGFLLAIKLTWINYFGAALTPMQSGGGPFQMYLMYKNGIGVGKTVAITLVRTFLSVSVLGLAVPFSLFMDDELPEMGWGMKGFLVYAAAIISLVLFCFIASVLKPQLIKRVFASIVRRINRFGFLKDERVAPIIDRIDREIDAYRDNVRAFMTTGKRHFIMSAVLAVIQTVCYLSVMPCMIWGVVGDASEVPYMHCLLVQALFIFTLYFMPTPGGSGAAEGGAVLVASVFVPTNMAGLIGVGWRMITEYTGIVLGALVAIRGIGWTLATQLASSKDSADVEGTSSK